MDSFIHPSAEGENLWTHSAAQRKGNPGAPLVETQVYMITKENSMELLRWQKTIKMKQ